MAELEQLRSHIAERYGFRARTLFTLDEDVILMRRDDGPNWVVRVFPRSRELSAVEGDVAVLDLLEAEGYPAERIADPEPVSLLEGRAVLVTEAVSGVPRAARRSSIKDAGGIRGLGALLARLHTLPRPSGEAARPGGAWHHMTDGSPVDELAAARAWLAEAEADAGARELGSFGALAEALERIDACDGLPEAMIHPDFVLANVVATPEPSMVLVDWAGAGIGPRLWSLAFLLWAEGYKDLRRVDLALAGYRRLATVEPEELERLEGAVGARPLVFAIWRLRNRGLSASDAAQDVVATRELARAIAARARTAIAQ